MEKERKMEREREREKREAKSLVAMLESRKNTTLQQAPGNPIHPCNSTIITIREIGGLMTRWLIARISDAGEYSKTRERKPRRYHTVPSEIDYLFASYNTSSIKHSSIIFPLLAQSWEGYILSRCASDCYNNAKAVVART